MTVSAGHTTTTYNSLQKARGEPHSLSFSTIYVLHCILIYIYQLAPYLLVYWYSAPCLTLCWYVAAAQLSRSDILHRGRRIYTLYLHMYPTDIHRNGRHFIYGALIMCNISNPHMIPLWEITLISNRIVLLRLCGAYRRQKVYHQWFRSWLAAWSTASQYPNQCWNIVSWYRLYWIECMNIFLHQC